MTIDSAIEKILGETVTQANFGKGNGSAVPVDVGAENIDHATSLCAQALQGMWEECAKRSEELIVAENKRHEDTIARLKLSFEAAIEAENKLHDWTVARLKDSPQACRDYGAATAELIKDRGATANQVASNALASSKALQAVLPQ